MRITTSNKLKRFNIHSIGAMAFCGMLFIICTSFQNRPQQSQFPKPSGIKNMLFFVQRSLNTNTIVYQLNVNDQSDLIVSSPVNIYWMNYAKKDGGTEPLNYVQRRFAYGIDVQMVDATKNSLCINFVSYKKKPIYIIKSPADNSYHAFCNINNKLEILNRVFIQIDGGSFWTPKIRYIDVVGTDPSSNQEVVERVIP